MDTVVNFPAREQSQDVVIKVAHGFDEMAMVTAVRAAVVLGELKRSFAEEFDGNDVSATHLVAFSNGEPIGTMRIRWFADFAKLEKLAIREPYRKLRNVNKLLRAALELCRRKGYRIVYGRALPRVVPLWRRLGAEACGADIETSRGVVTPLICPVPKDATAAPPISERMLGANELESVIRHREGEWPNIPVPLRPAFPARHSGREAVRHSAVGE